MTINDKPGLVMRGIALKTVLALLVVLLAVLQYRFWFGEHGWVKLQDVRQMVHVQQQENEGLRTRNDRQHAEVIDLKKGTDALEERARSNLGMVKEGETFYQVIEDRESKPE
ncbi:MAG: cell division protein FtsB [Gammaproteobacteria bacterium]|nr:cell division protein FtsB [Gammaproteobacteria bacterium]